MPYSRLFIFVEGPDDLRFFERVVRPALQNAYDLVEVRPYAQWKCEKLEAFIRSIEGMGANYLLATDGDDAPCVSEKKRRVQTRYRGIDPQRILVVVSEIEGWYLAGLDNSAAKGMGMAAANSTDELTKEEFLRMMPSKFDSRIDWMNEILQRFSPSAACKRNRSWAYFAEKYAL